MRAARRADLVLDGVRTVATELDGIGPTPQSESLGPERDPTKDPRVGALRGLPGIDRLVGEPTSDRVDVLVERLLDVDQPALARTEAEVFEGRDHHLDWAVHRSGHPGQPDVRAGLDHLPDTERLPVEPDGVPVERAGWVGALVHTGHREPVEERV